MARIYYIRDQKNVHTKKDGKLSRGIPVAVICTDLDKDKDQILFAFSVAYEAPKDPHLTCAECGFRSVKNEREMVYVYASSLASSGMVGEEPLVKKEFDCTRCGSKVHAHDKSDHFVKSRGREMALARLHKKQGFTIQNIPTEGGNKAIITRVMESVANRDAKGKFVFSKYVGDNETNFPMRIRKLAAAWLDKTKTLKQMPEKKLVDAVKNDKATTAA